MAIGLSKKETGVLRAIRNHLIDVGESPSVRQLMKEFEYKSPRSISIYIDNLIKKGWIKRKSDTTLQLVKDIDIEINNKECAQTVKVPLVGVVSCGSPILAEVNVSAEILVSTDIAKPPYKYFLLRAKGDSMNQNKINDGDIVLVRQQPNANNGDMVVALIDDEATIKEFFCEAGAIVLKPRSTNETHKPIILTRDFKIQGIVVTTIGKL
ncbi:MAG: transcriptional repressor LexA [Candidatus Firestonebacteria bacterium]